MVVDKTVTDAMRSVIGALLNSKSRRVTKYLTPLFTIKAARQRRVDLRYATETFTVTVGKPNASERKFINAINASFPVHRLQHTAFPKPRQPKS